MPGLLTTFSTVFVALLISAAAGAAGPPHEKLMPMDLAHVHEEDWSLPGDRLGIHALADQRHPWCPDKQPFVLMLGIGSITSQYVDIVNRFKDSDKHQLYFAAYEGWHHRASLNGEDLARELRYFKGKSVTLIAHSLGGIVARHSLNLLRGEAESFQSIDLFAPDIPWHGYVGPRDWGPEPGLLMRSMLFFVPEGMIDLRAGSWLFRNPEQELTSTPLPPNFRVHIAFSREGKAARDYNERPLRSLSSKIADWLNGGPEPTGLLRFQNFWGAIKTSSAFPNFMGYLRILQRSFPKLEDKQVLAALQTFYPEFPGDHVSILYEHPSEYSYLDYLSERLGD